MANEKINAYIEQIRLIIDRQLDLVYEYHNSNKVYGYADDFPFFNLFVNFKKNLYEGLVKDLYMQEVQADMENPKDLNLSVIFEPILRL